jgi:hypothetical protein
MMLCLLLVRNICNLCIDTVDMGADVGVYKI